MFSYKRPKERIILKEADADSVIFLAQKLSISETLARILVSRGLSEFDDSKDFFNPDFSKFLDSCSDLSSFLIILTRFSNKK